MLQTLAGSVFYEIAAILARDQALGRSRGGLTTKVHLIVDGRGWPLKVTIKPGQQGDITTAPALLEEIRARKVVARKAHNSNACAR